MQRHAPRHFTAFAITATVYATVAFLLFYTSSHKFTTIEKPKEKVMTLSLSAFTPEVVAPPKKVQEVVVEEVVEELVLEKIEEPEHETLLQKVEEEKIITPVIAKPKPKLVVVQKKKKKKAKAAKKPNKKKKVKKKEKSKKKKQASRQQASVQNRSSSKAEKNKFLSALRRKIDRHKFYPRIAKRRGMEGSVKVKFTILRNGKVGNIILNGPKVFHGSVRNAIKSAFPIKPKKSPFSLPKSMNITLHYQVR